MKHIAYTHQVEIPLVEIMMRSIRGVLPSPLRQPCPQRGRRTWCRRLLSVAGIMLALVIQASMLWLLAELVQAAHGVMELWLELANQQLDLLSLYNAIRPK